MTCVHDRCSFVGGYSPLAAVQRFWFITQFSKSFAKSLKGKAKQGGFLVPTQPHISKSLTLWDLSLRTSCSVADDCYSRSVRNEKKIE